MDPPFSCTSHISPQRRRGADIASVRLKADRDQCQSTSKVHSRKSTVVSLSLTLHDGGRVWKGLDWDLIDMLEEKGWIVDARSKSKSVVLTEEGEELARQFLRKHFGPGSKQQN